MRRDIIRNIQPDDLIVVTVPPDQLTDEIAQRIRDVVRSEVGCKVLIVTPSIQVGTRRHWWQR